MGGKIKMNSSPETRRARALRQNATESEKRLWYRIHSRQLNGHKFRRQHPVGRYVVDFACVELKLVVEIDGGQHAEQADADLKRTRELESLGYTVIRFWNNEVLGNIEGVLETLTLTLSQREGEL